MNRNIEKSFVVFSGGNDRAVIAFLRALRRCGKRASIVARTDEDRILYTSFRDDVKWVRESHELTLSVFEECIQHVRAVVGERNFVVLPSSEYFNSFLLSNRRKIESMGCEIPLVDAELYSMLTSKRSSADYFSAAGFAIPNELNGPLKATPPLVAKPHHNISGTGVSLYPKILTTQADINKFHAQNDPADYFFQEYLDGESIYLLVYLSRKGQDTFTWSQRNLLQQPGGKSMLFAEPATFHNSPTGRRLVEKLRMTGFWGLGMIEIIRVGDREVFIEMNPRIWGPLQLCVDYCQPLLQAFINEALDGNLHINPSPQSGRRPAREKYFWLGGLIETLAAGRSPVWHTTKQSVAKMIYASLRNDVYLRSDSWRCFFRDLIRTLKMAPKSE